MFIISDEWMINGCLLFQVTLHVCSSPRTWSCRWRNTRGNASNASVALYAAHLKTTISCCSATIAIAATTCTASSRPSRSRPRDPGPANSASTDSTKKQPPMFKQRKLLPIEFLIRFLWFSPVWLYKIERNTEKLFFLDDMCYWLNIKYT